jgi:hypothetical protein
MFFTLKPAKFASHFDEDARSYLCLGNGCPACGAGLKLTEHVYLPTWDAQNRRVAVLKFDTRPEGPAQKVLSFLTAYKDQLADVVAVVAARAGGSSASPPTGRSRRPTAAPWPAKSSAAPWKRAPSACAAASST